MDFNGIIQKLSSENSVAEFTPNEFTETSRRNPKYGYYEIKKSAIGPVMLEITYVDNDGDASDAMFIQSPILNERVSVFADLHKDSFKQGIRFIDSLGTVPSKLTMQEGFSRCFHYSDSEIDKKALNKHYLNARVIYDTMHRMMKTYDTKLFDVNGGYVIQSVFDNRDVEIMQIKQTQGYNGYKIMNIAIPSVGIQDKFTDRLDWIDVMVFNKAKKFIDRDYHPDIDMAECFSRWDRAYIYAMANIQRHRTKAR